jgi:hypothetical protein
VLGDNLLLKSSRTIEVHDANTNDETRHENEKQS